MFHIDTFAVLQTIARVLKESDPASKTRYLSVRVSGGMRFLVREGTRPWYHQQSLQDFQTPGQEHIVWKRSSSKRDWILRCSEDRFGTGYEAERVDCEEWSDSFEVARPARSLSICERDQVLMEVSRSKMTRKMWMQLRQNVPRESCQTRQVRRKK